MDKDILIVLSLFLLVLGFQFFWNESHLVYGLDDAYIHMGIAKNCAKGGTWGINKGENVSAASSFLYPGLLCLLFKFKLWDGFPALINFLSLFGILIYIKREYFISDYKLGLFLFFSFLPFIILSGMEHGLQILISLVFATEIMKAKPNNFLLLMASLFLPLIRFESFFLILSTILFVRHSKTKQLAFLLPFLIGALSLLIHFKLTGTLFPTSMLVKSPFKINSSLSIFKLLLRFPYTLMINSFFFAQYLITLVNFSLNSDQRSKKLSLIYLISSALQSQFSYVSIRYFAYLQVFFVLQFYNLDLNKAFKKISPVIVLVTLPTLLMSGLYFVRALTAPHDIYIQQYTLAKFISSGNFSSVVLNDIGTTSFYANTKIIDLYGLGNDEVRKAKQSNNFNKDFIKTLTKNVSFAAIYDDWFVGKIPDNFQKIGELHYAFKVISGKNRISLYSITESPLDLASTFDWPKEVVFVPISQESNS